MTSGLRFPPSLSGKFVPKFLRPFTLLSADDAKSNYTLALPPHLKIHNKFHASKLRPHFKNNDLRFLSRSLSLPPPVVPAMDGAGEEYSIEQVVGEKRVRGRSMYKVWHEGYSVADDEFRPEEEIQELAPV